MSRLILGLRALLRSIVDRAFAEKLAGLFGGAAGPEAAPPPRATRSDAVTLLAVLQREARFVDFVQEIGQHQILGIHGVIGVEFAPPIAIGILAIFQIGLDAQYGRIQLGRGRRITRCGRSYFLGLPTPFFFDNYLYPLPLCQS